MQVPLAGPMITFGCCDFQLKPEDGSIVCGRSMEFPIATDSKITIYNRGEKHASIAPDKSTGVEWVSKYGYVAVDALGLDDPVEGMNEKGLSFAFLSLQCSEYQQIGPAEMKQALGISDVGAWILGNFSTIDEIEEGIKGVKIWGDFIDPVTQEVLKLHIALHDAKGNNLVIEFLNGQVIATRNPIGVLTNDPTLPYHLANLLRYNCLSAGQSTPRTINGTQIPCFAGSDSMVGLPGDWGAISRFVRVAIIISVAAKIQTALDGVNFAQHVLNNVDRPIGTAFVKFNDQTLYETTRWATVKDLTNLDFYYRSYGDLALRVIRLSKLNFENGQKHNDIPISSGKMTVIDMTQEVSGM